MNWKITNENRDTFEMWLIIQVINSLPRETKQQLLNTYKKDTGYDIQMTINGVSVDIPMMFEYLQRMWKREVSEKAAEIAMEKVSERLDPISTALYEIERKLKIDIGKEMGITVEGW